MYFVLFSVLAYLSPCYCLIGKDENESHCGLLKQWLGSASVSVQIGKKGFHRELETTVELSPDVIHEVRVLLIHRCPSGVYVDPYQLASLSHKRDWQILLDSAIDLEVPAHKTSGFVAYVYSTLDGPTPKQLKITIPIHGRYSEPSFDGKTFTSVKIEPPELLLRTDKCMEIDELEPYTVMDAPCTADNSSMCSWVKMHHQQEHGAVILQFPVGDGSLVMPVCGGTLLVTLICCVALCKYMWKHKI
ncbi:phosphatidylinositol-glycan biosynthesis class X protein [Anabas testudineus]|uniref:Phosphatidylinositol-glycan biosynthesis class X protein n=1 Tax=Anabas testudineus TaxID=64144 RepID=A0A3Q1IVQ0_ANATE|nr:phosphatidylinositol-glycan biosynthesis class X protein [Anabas testudineus]